MKTRPWPILILALLHVLAPFGNFFFNVHLSGMTVWQKWQEMTATPNLKINLLTFCAPIVAGVAIYACKKWSFWLYLAMIALISTLNFLVYKAQAGHAGLGSFLAMMIIDLGVVSYVLIPTVRVIYFDPRLRWWEASPRYHAGVPGRWKNADTEAHGEVVNFSQGGLFFKSAQIPADNSVIEVSLWDGPQERRFAGQVIHHAKQNLTGFGLRFDRSTKTTREAAEFVRHLEAQGKLIRDRLPGPEDSLSAWFKRLIKTGKGLTPDLPSKK